MSYVAADDDNGLATLRVALPRWLSTVWIYLFDRKADAEPKEMNTVKTAEAKPPIQHGLDEFGRVEFAMPGFGTC